jgi:dTDP-4-amino-4,6-dideoxygalactose transaminase
MNIPFVDLKAQYFAIKESIDNAIAGVIGDSAFIGGEYVKKFENAFAAHLGAQHCIGCANGTDSIEILLKAFNIGKGDEVIVPALSWISTSEAVTAIGATPVFVDIEPDYYTIDVSRIEEKITPATKAIIPVHLYGHPADMPGLMKIAAKHNLYIIEDCAQSHDAEVASKKTGTWGNAASFSFYPGKNLGAYGDAGCMTTDNSEVAALARMIANHGQIKKHQHIIEGRNSRLDGLQAAILSAKLPHLNKWTEARIRNSGQYTQLLQRSSLILPKTKKDARHVFHLYVVRVKNRDFVMAELKKNGIETFVHYPKALPFLKAYEYLKHVPQHFPVAAAAQDEILSLPMYPELSQPAIEYVAQHVLASIKL